MGIIRMAYLYCGTELDYQEWDNTIDEAINSIYGGKEEDSDMAEKQYELWHELLSDRFMIERNDGKLRPAIFISSLDVDEQEHEELEHKNLKNTAVHLKRRWLRTFKREVQEHVELAPSVKAVFYAIIKAASNRSWHFYHTVTVN